MRSLVALASVACAVPAAARPAAPRIVVFHPAGADAEGRRLALAVELYTRDLGCAVALRRWPGSPALAQEEAKASEASFFLRFDSRRRPATIELWRIAPVRRYRFRVSPADRRNGFTPVALKIRAFVAPVSAPPGTRAAGRAPPGFDLPPAVDAAAPKPVPPTPASRPAAVVKPGGSASGAMARPTPAPRRAPASVPLLPPPRRPAPHPRASRAQAGPFWGAAPLRTRTPARQPWQLDLRGGVLLSTFPDQVVPTALVRATYWTFPWFALDLEAAFVGGFNERGSAGDASLWDLPLGVGAAWRVDLGRLSFWGGPRARLHLLVASGDSDDEARRGAAQRLALGLGGSGTAAWSFGRVAALASVGVEAVLPHYEFTLDGAPGPALGVLDIDLSLGVGGTF